MKWYDLKAQNTHEDNSKNSQVKRDNTIRVKYKEIITERIRDFEKIASVEIEENVQYRFVTDKNFNALLVLQYLIEKYKVSEVYIAIYRMNWAAVDLLKKLIEDNKIECEIVVSNFFRENKKYERWAMELVSFAEKNKAKVKFAQNHAKVFLAKTSCGKHIVFEGSGNLSDNARIEQYLFENNKTTFEFHKNWIKNITDGKH